MTAMDSVGSVGSGRVERIMRLESERLALATLKARLDALKLWLPARHLSKVVGEAISDVDSLHERLEAKAIVAVVGGTGTGKSTLVNALSGKDGVVEEGHARPTTRSLTALARKAGDANTLLENFAPGEINVVADAYFRFRDVVIVDTPDTDSAECAEYSGLLDRVLRCADALVCVFPAQDPKRRDNLTRLSERVASYRAKHVFLVVNQCDRINADELDELRADFERNIRKSWDKTGEVFLVSARSSLEKPNWVEGERPLHAVNQFGELVEAIAQLDGARFADERIERAKELRQEAERCVRECINECGDWKAMRDELRMFERSLAGKVVEKEADRIVERTGDFSALLYRKAAERWRGPIGLYLHVGQALASVASSLRFLNPANWPKRAIAKFQGLFDGDRTSEGALCDESLAFDWETVKGAALGEWPAIGARIVNDFRMSPDLLDGENAIVFDGLEEALQRRWPQSLNSVLEGMAKARSGAFRQLVAHLPLAALMGWSLWELGRTYFTGRYLPQEYYPQLCTIALLLWLLPSWLVQARLSVSGDRLRDALRKRLVDSDVAASMVPVLREVESIVSLAG